MSDFRFTDRRKTFRHDLHYPVIKSLEGSDDPETCQLQNISDGGLAIYSRQPYEPGIKVEISFPILGDNSSFTGEIVWCRNAGDDSGRYVVGSKHVPEHATEFKRVVEMICHIESYRQMQEHLSKEEITPEAAAKEWMEKYGGEFPE